MTADRSRPTVRRQYNVYADQHTALRRLSRKLVRQGRLTGGTRQRKLTEAGAVSELVRRMIEQGLRHPEQLEERP